MSRIRSIHPGLWTDDAFMALSMAARLLAIGIWTEAFDDGVFDWKPLTLKARIFPADNVDVDVLLAELEAGGFVRRENCSGKNIGLVRNFREYQRPKKPNSSGMMKAEWRTYVGLTGSSSEPVPNQASTNGEKSPQMEGGGVPPLAPQGGRRSRPRGSEHFTIAAQGLDDGDEGPQAGVGDDRRDAGRVPLIAAGH